MQELFVSFGVVLVAELGDKTQIAILALAARGRPLVVWGGAAAAFALLTVLAVIVGALLVGQVGPWASVAAGLLLVGMGLWAFFTKAAPAAANAGAVAGSAAFGTVLLAELGDKSQLATASLATAGSPWLVGIGAWSALAVGAALAAWLGHVLAKRLRADVMRRIGGLVLVLAGAFVLATR